MTKEFLSALNSMYNWDDLNVLKLSNIPKTIKRTKKNTQSKIISRIRKLVPNNTKPGYKWIPVKSDLINDSGIYVILKHHKAYYKKGNIRTLSSLFDVLRIINPKATLYGIFERDISKIGKKWKPLYKVVNNKIKVLRNSKTIHEIVRTPHDSPMDFKVPDIFDIVENHLDDLDPNGICAKWLDATIKASKLNTSKLRELNELEKFAYMPKTQMIADSMESMAIEFEKRYPLIMPIKVYNGIPKKKKKKKKFKPQKFIRYSMFSEIDIPESEIINYINFKDELYKTQDKDDG